MLKLTGKPKKMVVLGHSITIEYTDTMDPGEYGESNGYKRLIKINKSMPEEEFHSTLIHELFHMVIHITGWSEVLRKFDSKESGGDIEEGLALVIENGLAPLFQLHK